ncbi:ATP-dependent DNA helicase [Microbulbifer salipaludis]|uniref:ATP-dependent DNA helicase n=1 Tax=Microbulbifer salipaludis TaxID=187980 RepID=A0ABS3E2A2_9GAMM|nr:ATP-dependent DNA helicase [Microbulbifer salipaludis]
MGNTVSESPAELQAQTALDNTLSLSVGELVAFACRSGDLVGELSGGPSAQEGIRAHQRLQKKRPAGSQAEYRLQETVEQDGHTVVLRGRVDILHPQPDLHRAAQLDEIKTTYVPPHKLAESARDLHWAQLKIYGFCYGLQQQFSADTPLALQMLWHNLKEKKTYPESREFRWHELETFARTALSTYLQWHRRWQAHRQAVRASARTLPFPFAEYRAGQRTLAVAAYRCLRDGGELLVEAPTGIGKTISTLFPAIKAVGETTLDQLVYLTAKNSGRQVVRETAARLHAGGLTLSVLELQARDKTCSCNLGLCSRDDAGICPRTRGFFDRLPEARRALLGRPLLTPEVIAEEADRLQLCPFALSLQMLPWADLVVCDFNYVFDPLVQMQGLRDTRLQRALLIDEAHNLSDRARAMFSAKLSRADSRRAAAACKGSHPALQRAIQSLVRALDSWVEQRRESGQQAAPPGKPEKIEKIDEKENGKTTELWITALTDGAPHKVSAAVHKVLLVVSQLWEQSQAPPEAIADWLRALFRYQTVEQLAAEHHRCITRAQHLPNRDSRWREQEIELLCLSAADYLQQAYALFHSVIAFSATLRPPSHVVRQLGLQAEAPYLALPSPFAAEQLGLFVCPFVDTRYRARQRASDTLVDMIARTYHSRPGNYLVFFPSYRFLQQVAECFAAQYPEIPLVQQASGSSDPQRSAFLDNFQSGRRSLGFAIMGGVFGEGVDYVGEQLVGTIVVGVGLPQVNEEQELLRAACEQRGENGFDAAYRYPGLTRVLQTAGRVIRSESDRGVVILADNRFADPFYRALYPQHWHPQTCNNGHALSAALDHFWNG